MKNGTKIPKLPKGVTQEFLDIIQPMTVDQLKGKVVSLQVQLVGRILWWNDRDGFGVIEDGDGNEYYFDSSVIGRSSQSIKRNSIVVFEVNKGIRDCLCAHKVKVANATERLKEKGAV